MGHSSGQGQRAACAIVVAALAAGISVSAQRSPSVPRTSDGHPDVQGLWNSGTLTPLQRPKEFAGHEFMTAEEAADFEAHALERLRAASDTGQISEASREALEETFQLLWAIRLEHQVVQHRSGAAADDFVDPQGLGPVRRRALKEAFRILAAEQRALQLELGLG